MLLRDKAATSRNQRRWAGSWEAAVTSHNGETSRATPARSPPALRSSILLAFKADSVLTLLGLIYYYYMTSKINNAWGPSTPYPAWCFKWELCLCWGHPSSWGSIHDDESPGTGNVFQPSPNLFSLMGRVSQNEKLVGSSGLNTATDASPIFFCW